jgi:hypothetical protein
MRWGWVGHFFSFDAFPNVLRVELLGQAMELV